MSNNEKIIRVFNLLIQKYKMEQQKALTSEKTGYSFKINTFRKAIKIIESLPYDIISGKQLEDVKGIGTKTINKIDEILETGTLSSLKDLTLNNNLSLQDNLMRITGIGPVKAKSLIDQKITLEILQDALEKDNMEFLETHLTHHSILGLKYLKDLEKKIPALEIANVGVFLRKIIKDEDVDFTICGSFRRRKAFSGDIDVLFYPKVKYDETFLPKLIYTLIKKKFLIDHLTIGGSTKYMGICKLKKTSTPRRIDIRYIKRSELATSLLYFTGSGIFNRNMRTYALKKGYKLNEYGLFKMKDGKPGFKMATKEEKDIFRILGLEFVEPRDRLESYVFPK